MNVVCQKCNRPFLANPYEVKRGRGRFCSHSCAATKAGRPNQAGPNNPNWKGGIPRKGRHLRYKETHPERFAAHRAVTGAIRRGDLIRLPCEACGNPRSEAHHENYATPLIVRWFCKKHHLETHYA